MLRPVIHLNLSSYMFQSTGQLFFIFHVEIQLFLNPLLKRISFSQQIALAYTFVRNQLTMDVWV